MGKRLADKFALVTGSTRGLGYGIAKSLVGAGLEGVAIHGRTGQDCQRVVDEILEMGAKAVAVPGDLSEPAAVKEVFDGTIAHFGRLDILVNNAGGALKPGGLFWTKSLQDFVYQVNVNYTAVFMLSKYAAARMVEQGSGRIINISSGGAHLAHGGAAIYNSAKAAVEHFTRCAAVELGPYNVLVNCIAPGSVAKKEGELAKEDPRTRLASYIIPMGRIGFPHEVGDLVVFFASEESKYITGQVITIDGGRECRLPTVVPVVLDEDDHIKEVISPAAMLERLAEKETNRTT